MADNSTGFAKTFKVHLTFENSIYETQNGCDPVQKKKMSFETDESRIQLRNLEPYSQYSVKIESHSEYGISDPSRKHSFTTHPGKASAPRDIFIDFTPHDDNSSLVIGTLTWSPPCYINGRFDLYTVSLKGNRENFPEDSRIEASFDQNITFDDLRRGFEYEFRIQAVNEKQGGKMEKLLFKTPSGSK